MRTKLKITEGIFPMPVLMVATYNEDGSVNVTAAENVMVDGKIDMSKVNTIALSFSYGVVLLYHTLPGLQSITPL